MIDAPAFSVHVTKFIKEEIEKGSLDKAELDKRFNKTAEAVDEKKIKVEDMIRTKRIDSVRSRSQSTDISDDKKTNP